MRVSDPGSGVAHPTFFPAGRPNPDFGVNSALTVHTFSASAERRTSRYLPRGMPLCAAKLLDARRRQEVPENPHRRGGHWISAPFPHRSTTDLCATRLASGHMASTATSVASAAGGNPPHSVRSRAPSGTRRAGLAKSARIHRSSTGNACVSRPQRSQRRRRRRHRLFVGWIMCQPGPSAQPRRITPAWPTAQS